MPGCSTGLQELKAPEKIILGLPNEKTTVSFCFYHS